MYRNVRTPMRDDVKLSANIFFPAQNGVVDFNKKHPSLMSHSGYMSTYGETGTSPTHMPYFVNEQGFVFVINAFRDAFRSGGGEIRPLMNEGWLGHPDGVDTINWPAKQPWSNGRVFL